MVDDSSQDHGSANDPLLLLLDADVTLMPRLTRWTRVQMPNATRARTTNRTMMMMAMVSFFFTMVAVLIEWQDKGGGVL